MKKRLAKYNQVKFFLKDRSQVAGLAQITSNGIACERVDELTYLMRFDRDEHSTAGSSATSSTSFRCGTSLLRKNLLRTS